MKKELSRTQKKIFGAVMGFLAINIAAQIAASWSFAQKIGFDPRYLPDVGGTILYYPFEFLYLLAQYNDVAPFLLKTGKVIAGGGFLASILFVLILFFWNGKKQLTSSGSARWATADEIREKGLLSPVDPVKDGVIVGAWDTGMDYEKRLAIAEWLGKLLHKDKFDILPHIPGKREYIVDNAPTHILMCAPSRSGKGIGVVIPTFASWQGSMVVADPKRENLNETGAYRKYVMGHNVIEFAPADGRPTSRWNPLNEIRWGSANEGRDVSNLVSILVGEGSGNDKYWLDNAKDLIIGVVTHLKYVHCVENTKKDLHFGDPGYRETSMYDVYQFLAAGMKADEAEGEEKEKEDANKPTGFRKTLSDALYEEVADENTGKKKKQARKNVHIPKTGVVFDLPNPVGTSEDSFIVRQVDQENETEVTFFTEEAKLTPGLHPVVVTKFNSFISKSPNEAGSVLSSAITALMIFSEKTIIDNTLHSDFYLRDIRNSKAPTDLYLVTPPSDLKRVGKLFRLIIEFMVIKSTETLGGDKHRCLLLIDEFPAFGKMDTLVRELGYIAGYGLKTLIIIQGLEQLTEIYKSKELLTNCQTQVYFGPNDEQTRKYVSTALGNKTILVKQRSAGEGLFAKNNYTWVEKQRALLLPDETSSVLSNKSAILLEGLRILSPKNKFFLMKDMLVRFKDSQKKYDRYHRIGLREKKKGGL